MFYSLISTKTPIISLSITLLCLAVSLSFTLIFPGEASTYLFSQAIDSTLFHLLILVSGFYLNTILIDHKVVGLNNYSIVILISILLSAIPGDLMHLKFLLGFLILIHMSKKIMLFFNTSESAIPEFEMGIFSGIAFLIHPVFVFVVLYSIVSIVISKANNWRDYIAVILGFIFVLVLKASYLLFTNELQSFESVFSITKQLKIWSLVFNFTLVLQIILAGFAVYILNYYRNQADKLNIKIRVNYWAWAWMGVLFYLSIHFVSNTLSVKNLLLFSYVPIVVILQLFFTKTKKDWVNDVIFLILILISIALRF